MTGIASGERMQSYARKGDEELGDITAMTFSSRSTARIIFLA